MPEFPTPNSATCCCRRTTSYTCIGRSSARSRWAGVDLIRRVEGGEAQGLVGPLVTTASGAKFGKTEGGAVWLDPSLTSPDKFYQFWYNTDDRDAEPYLKLF